MKIARLLVLVAIANAACVPGDLDPDRYPPTKPGRSDAGAATPPVAITDQTALAGCAQWPTVGEFERGLIVPRCGTGTCHSTNGKPFAPDMAALPVHPRLVDRPVMGASTACDRASDRYIDSRSAPEDSYLVSKVRDDNPRCPDGKAAGARMPLGVKPLLADEIACFVSYAAAVTGR